VFDGLGFRRIDSGRTRGLNQAGLEPRALSTCLQRYLSEPESVPIICKGIAKSQVAGKLVCWNLVPAAEWSSANRVERRCRTLRETLIMSFPLLAGMFCSARSTVLGLL